MSEAGTPQGQEQFHIHSCAVVCVEFKLIQESLPIKIKDPQKTHTGK